MIELAHRESAGAHIVLFWFQAESRLTVFVVGSCEEDSFQLDAGPSSALEVFYHPYAYAALPNGSRSQPLNPTGAREAGAFDRV